MHASRPHLKILIVDDHAGMRRIVQRACEGLAGEVIECESGEAAVDAFTQHAPDWVIMDLRMPGMGGLKATESIRLLDPQARVIIISQFTEAEFRDQARGVGALEFVGKEDLSQVAAIICGTTLKS